MQDRVILIDCVYSCEIGKARLYKVSIQFFKLLLRLHSKVNVVAKLEPEFLSPKRA